MDIILPGEEECPKTDAQLSGEPVGWVAPLCAWCLSEQGLPAGEGSHGICRMHAGRLLLQRRARIAQKGS
jgi:hypothetical protein